MKILYIGYYRDGTGWAHAAQNYILSLDAAGLDVVPRFIKLNNSNPVIPDRIAELESKSSKNCDIVIQHLLPQHMSFDGKFEKNIALYVYETDNCSNSYWPHYINLMSEAWVPNKFMANELCKNSNIFCPHYVVPHACDLEKYQKIYKNINIQEIEDTFVFYYIGEFNRRKNLSSFVKAFHLEFSPEENVSLVIKSHIPGQKSSVSEEYIKKMCNDVKSGLKLYKDSSIYKNEVIISDYIDEQQIMAIHQKFDCFVSASVGEAWGIPIFDAMAMGNTPICTKTHGPSDFLDNAGYLVDYTEEPCFGMLETFEDSCVGNENWRLPKTNDIRKCMRNAFLNDEKRQQLSTNGIDRAYEYSFAEVGNIMKNILEGNVEPSNKRTPEIKELNKI